MTPWHATRHEVEKWERAMTDDGKSVAEEAQDSARMLRLVLWSLMGSLAVLTILLVWGMA